MLNICLGASSTVAALAPVMLRQATAYIDQRFPPPNIVDLIKQRGDGGFDMADAARAMYEEASPKTKCNDSQRDFGVWTLPSDDAGRELAAAIAETLPEATIVFSDRSDEIVIHREQILGSLNDLEQMGSIAEEAYRQRQAQDPSALHAREDIPNWNPEAMIVG